MHSGAESRSYQETQEFRFPTRRFKNQGFLPGNSGIQDSWQKIHVFRDVEHWAATFYQLSCADELPSYTSHNRNCWVKAVKSSTMQ